MKIKPMSRKQRIQASLKRNVAHWWLLPEKPKKTARLASQNKQNKLRRRRVGPSEFIRMVESIAARFRKEVAYVR